METFRKIAMMLAALLIGGATFTIYAQTSLSPVEKNGKWGFEDSDGNIVVSYKYDDVMVYDDGIAEVRIGDDETGKYGLFDTKTGKEIAPCKYSSVMTFSNDSIARVMIGDYETDKYGLIDIRTGKELTTLTYDDINDFCEGLARVKIGDYDTGKYGFINTKGKTVVPCKYGDAEDFSEGLAAVSLDGEKYGYINTKGETVIPLKYDGAGSFSEGFAKVRIAGDALEGNWGFIDTTGKKKSAVFVKNGANVKFILEGESTIKGDNVDKDEHESCGIEVGVGTNVIFGGEGTLNVYGGRYGAAIGSWGTRINIPAELRR